MFAMDGYRFSIAGKSCDIIMNASGAHCKTKEQMDQLITNGINTIITKSCTLEKNSGNPLPNFQEINDHISLNCLGMPNWGYKYYRDLYLEYSVKKGITYIISMDASNWDELREMLLDYDLFISNSHNHTRELVEINISCPNKTSANNKSPGQIIAYNPQEVALILENIKLLDLQHINIGLKLAPYIDRYLLQQISQIIINYSSIVKYIVCGNSIPNGMILDITTTKPILSIGTGGISGTANRLIGVANVKQFREIFNSTGGECKNIIILGCGGVETSDDVLQYLIAGAKGVQVGRILYLNGVSSMNNIWHNLKAKL